MKSSAEKEVADDDSGSKLAEAWGAWVESEEGQQCMDTKILALPDYQRRYLEDRLQRAFRAGADFAEKEG